MSTTTTTIKNPAATPQQQQVPASEFGKTPQVTGMYILADALQKNGVTDIFGLIGIPVTELSYLAQGMGINFYGFRFEQQAGMAAATYGYLTKKPGILLTVSSLGFLNGLTATTNATVNCYPMIQISGSSDRAAVDLDQGTYEGLDQLAIAKPLVKAAYRINKAEDIPTAVARAVRAAVSGRPGGVYLDVTVPCMSEVVDRVKAEAMQFAPIDPASEVSPNQAAIDRAVALLKSAKKPAIILGKGAAYSQNDELIKQFIETTGLPFYPMSMAKGLLPDNHPQSAISARSMIMEQADVVILLGARLNWLLSRGHGKWNPEGKFIQVEIDPIEMDVNRKIDAPVVGDIKPALEMMLAELGNQKLDMDPTWLPQIQQHSVEANAKMAAKLAPSPVPMTHWDALAQVKKVLEANPDITLINEGANTLDDCRDAVDMFKPRHRIDCATWAIMGMGMGSAIGAAVATKGRVMAVEGDSAFGFSGMEVATMCRYKLPITVVVFNNGGIYNNIGENIAKPGMPSYGQPAPTTLDLDARYNMIADAFGGKGYYVSTPEELATALQESLTAEGPVLINVQLAADAGKESGHIGYLNPQPLIKLTV